MRRLLEAIATMICSHKPGITNWNGFILGQAQNILKVNKIRENPQGLYYSLKKIDASFFSVENRAKRDKQMTDEEHPFLYKLLKSKILHQSNLQDQSLATKDDEKDDTDSLRGPLDKPVELDEETKAAARIHRAHMISKTICLMLTFTSNRRKNSMQLENAVTFVACGISDRVNKYLNFIGLCSSRKMAHLALRTLGKKDEQTIKNRMKLGPAKSPKFCPLICINNLDFQEAVHVRSVENQSSMFHGTWGYLHQPNPKILASVNPEDLTLEAYRSAIANSANDVISPSKFISNKEEGLHYRSVLKSQIASVFMTYIAKTNDKTPIISLTPPLIEVLAPQKPDITMLKLMVASDNSAKGVGEVLEGLARQSGLTPDKFAFRLLILEGNLGTCLNLSSLRAQHKPNNRPKESLANCFTLLGGAHTLWNVAQVLISLHFGDSLDLKGLGCWHFLEALGVKSNQILNKKDFSLMLVQIQKVHEATIAYLILLIMGKQTDSFPKEKLSMKAQDIIRIIDSVYNKFLSPQALLKSKDPKAPCLANMLLRLRDFSTIVECNRAMKGGDIGRVMNIWKQWWVMARGIQGLTNYAIDLPRMYLLLTKVLPPGLRLVIKHSLLISPTGRPNHFVAKDFYLENQNFFLKYFYNNTGMGTKIDRLKDEYSLAIPVVS
ncbi:hypothetical protein PTTG_27164 [Puccinia triticina 1-1 BBBD Race 1]|uniref:DUF6589 domain-containing protein n=1 Tax=Puccinia triticina (isolate 1-1 / race 1 (BBBD)) TaxID=630390 RepID=A0A180GNC0_PUCT1|nr:hypothetical protein PTTG_27164 [Puccinia triticina 1-1 BBBD Race 1]